MRKGLPEWIPRLTAGRIAGAVGVLLLLGIVLFLQPGSWRYYTDEVGISRKAKDTNPGFVAWEQAQMLPGEFGDLAEHPEPTFSPDGTLMVFVRQTTKHNTDLYASRWNGQQWGKPSPIRALNSKFNETGPAFSRDGQALYFATDRPGSLGNYDIWAARWDGSQFAWPLPLTLMVNSPFDEMDPAPSASGNQLYFASNRPNRPLTDDEKTLSARELMKQSKPSDFDLFAATRIPAGITNREVERATSMLYYLREGALADPEVMRILGGSRASEAAVSRALAWLAKIQEKDGHWDMQAHSGAWRHDVGGTAFALLAFLGRGQRHDKKCKYQDTVKRAIDWLIAQQNPIEGDIRGSGDMYDHGIASLALAEAYGVTKHEDLVLPAQAAIEFIVKGQNTKTGGWRYKPGQNDSDLSVSGWMIMALKSAEFSGLRVPKETFIGARKWLAQVSGGYQGGLYGYQGGGGGKPAMIATGYFCCQLMGLSPNTFKAFETSDYLQGKGRKRQITDAYFCYYATLCSYQNQGPLWRDWQKQIQKQLPPAQKPEGFWQPTGNHSRDMGKVVYSALVALSLQAHYRYTPMYGLGFEPSKELAVSNLDRDSLSEMPLYRRAKRLFSINSKADDRQAWITEHGDFLYFASNRTGGEGGLDLYRSRISGKEPDEPMNLGPTVNTRADETGPALRANGFHIVFGSHSKADKGPPRLHQQTVSRRVFQEHTAKGIPKWAYLVRIRHRLLALVLALVGLVWLVGKKPKDS